MSLYSGAWAPSSASWVLLPPLGLASADGADGVHTEGDILSSEVIAGGVILREPDDAHDSVDELDHQNGCKKRQVLTKGHCPPLGKDPRASAWLLLPGLQPSYSRGAQSPSLVPGSVLSSSQGLPETVTGQVNK